MRRVLLTARLRSALISASLIATFLIAGCARTSGATTQKHLQNELWTGRISLQVQSEPAQSFSAGFELRGKLEQGDLTLISPLGSVLGVMRWSPQEAVLDSGNQKIQRFASADDLMAQATGAALPLSALFSWLKGDSVSISGWSADLSRFSEGRISATRTLPAPQADLRVVLDQ